MPRPFMLCADDFGLTEGIDEAILDLAARGRLSAVSCMVGAPAWRLDAPRLARIGPGIDLGLHLTLTKLAPLTGASTLAPGGRLRGQASLYCAGLAGRLRAEDVRREIARQIEAFEEAIGRLPDYVDGHHHAHQYPRIARLVADEIAARAPGWRPWLRVCTDSLSRIRRRGVGMLAAATLSVAGRTLRRMARARGIETNEGISGFYDVRRAESYAAVFPAFLRAMGPRHLVVCHPGHCANEAERERPWMRCREHEYAFLASAEFPALCAREGVQLAAFREFTNRAAPDQSNVRRSTR